MEKPDVINSFKMKKLLGIVVLGLLLGGNAYAEDKFVGKWINEKTNSVYEIRKNEKTSVIEIKSH